MVLLTESKVSVAERELLEAQKIQTHILSVKEAVNTFVQQGMWVALTVDLYAMSRRLIYVDNEDNFLWLQRDELIKTLEALTDENFPGIIFETGIVPNPISYVFRVLKPLKASLERKGHGPDGVYGYEEVAPIPTMILVFVFPGMLRIMMSQIGDIVPG